jgi:hypothetical protein
MPQITVCANAQCASENLEEDRMVIALGQEGKKPKEIIVKRCVDCGCESYEDTISS